MNNLSLSGLIKEKAYEMGYDLCGIISTDRFDEYITYLDERITNFPDSKNLFEDLYDLASPREKAEWAKSIVVCIRRYNKYKIPDELNNFIGKLYLFDRRLEYSDEYKGAVMFESYLKDMGMLTYKNGVAARWAAVKAGLGSFGRNNFLYTKFGSWVGIDTWIVNKELEYGEPLDSKTACPPNCRRCIDSCPTKALSGPFMMDMGKCVAQLSFFSTEIYPAKLIPEELRDKMGTWLYGCDICQNVCPMNKNKWEDADNFPGLYEFIKLLKPENIVQMDEKTFQSVLQPRFWYIEKDGLWIWKCNALQAMANSGEPKYEKYIISACDDINENVREMAKWACKKLGL